MNAFQLDTSNGYSSGPRKRKYEHRRSEDIQHGFVDLWGSFVGRADMYMKDGLHLSGKGAAVFADKLSAAVDSDLGTMTNIFGSKHSLN